MTSRNNTVDELTSRYNTVDGIMSRNNTVDDLAKRDNTVDIYIYGRNGSFLTWLATSRGKSISTVISASPRNDK